MKPTIIRFDNDDQDGGQGHKPTVIRPTALPSSPPAPAPTPTVFKPTAIQARTPPVAPPQPVIAPTPRVTAPTAMLGVRRERIAVTSSDLAKIHSGVKTEVLEAAVRFIVMFNAQEATEGTTILWGHDLQKKYGELIQECLTLSQSKILTKVRERINRIMEILSLINLKKVCGLEGTSGFLGNLLRQSSKEIDSLEELKEAQRELAQLVKYLNGKVDELLTLRASFEKVSNGINYVGDEIEASGIAAAFLADHLKQTKAGVSQRFLERSGSLLQTLTQIRGSSTMQEMQIAQPLRLISAVQNVASVMLPNWFGSIVAIMTMLESGSKPNVTEVDDIGDQTKVIMTELQKK